ncbi:unnamed protein product [Mytilus coruscus]|uniref:TIR domain-containing protein n=1 Tax=Mytilus coruscus TaxID=42192 RepID=A0A6J8BVS6_MYTCO|nr:unnamed protein product [Mytilus coruscus]
MFTLFSYYILAFTNITFVFLLPRYINENNVTFPRSNSDVDLDNAKDGDLMHTIQSGISDNQSVYEHDRIFPFCQQSFHRYIGEDVRMQCKWPKKHVPVIDYEIKWTLNGNVILNSDKRKITSTRGNYNVETLSIFLIDEKDYGKYESWVSSNPTEKNIGRYSKSCMIAAMVMTQMHDIESYIYVPVGNVLTLEYEIEFSFQTKVLSWDYQIESILIGATTLENHSKILFHGCSLFSRIALMGRYYDIDKPTIAWMSNKRIHLHATICTFAPMFGTHSIYITREFSNETTYKTQHVTTPLRLHYIVLPDESYNVYKKKYVKYRSDRLTGIEKSDLVDEVLIWLIRQIIEVFLLVLTLFAFWKLCKYSFYVLDKLILTPICKYIMKLADFGVESSNIACLSSISTAYAFDYEYDVLILSTENDKDFITENSIITCFEDKEYTVCYPERDFDAGIPVFDLFTKALQSSHTIIVVCSRDFFEDNIMNAVVFEILNMSSEDGKLKNKNILLIKTDACEISKVKKRYEVLDTSQLFSMKSCKKQLCAWLQARIPRIDWTTIFVNLVVFMFLNFLSVIGCITVLILKHVERFSESILQPYCPYIFLCSICCTIYIGIWTFQNVILLKHERKRVEKILLSL